MKGVFVGCILFALIASAHGMYGAGSAVKSLSPTTIKELKTGLWIAEFYAPWCGHCQNLAPEYEKAASALKGLVNVAAIDCDEHKSIAQEYSIKGFPTIKVFSDGKSSDYSGERTAAGIVDSMLKEAKNLAKSRLGGKSKSSSSSSSSSGSGSKKKDSSVVTLTSDNFDELVLGSSDTWMVEFYAPWCGHCKSLAPVYEEAATSLYGKAKLGAVDATENSALAQKYGVTSYPTLKVFGSDKESPTDFTGSRTKGAIVEHMEEAALLSTPVKVVELTGQSVMDESCAGKQICVLSFLPHILDTKAEGRNRYLEVLAGTAKRFRSRGWGFVWSEAGAQADLEGAVGVGGFGYPAMVALNTKKERLATLKDAFTKNAAVDFLERLIDGEEKTIKLDKPVPNVAEVKPWDGLDGQAIEEDEFSLDDLMG